MILAALTKDETLRYEICLLLFVFRTKFSFYRKRDITMNPQYEILAKACCQHTCWNGLN